MSLFLSAGSDYSSISSTLTLTSSMAMVEFSIPIVDDSIVESDEQFTVVLSSSDPNVLTSVNQATVTIVDNDGELHTPREREYTNLQCTCLSYHNAIMPAHVRGTENLCFRLV